MSEAGRTTTKAAFPFYFEFTRRYCVDRHRGQSFVRFTRSEVGVVNEKTRGLRSNK